MSNKNMTQRKSYWMVTGEWIQPVVQEGSVIATPENPNPQHSKAPIFIRRSMTEFIDVHPVQWVIAVSPKRMNYALLNQFQINKTTFDAIQAMIASAMQAAQQQDQSEEAQQLSTGEENASSSENAGDSKVV